MFTLRYRTLMVFAAGLAVALIGVFALQAWRADAAPGDSDTTFVPITPCRLIDTRPAPFRVGPGTFGTDDTRTIQARGTNGNCIGIPTDAVGLSLNVTAVDASQLTFLTFWPDGTRPTSSNLNPAPGQPPTPNAVTTNLSGSGAFKVYNRFGNVDVIVDINGYYTKSSLQELSADITALEADNTDLEARIAELEASSGTDLDVLDRLAALEADNTALQTKTASMSNETVDGQPTVRFSDVNVQIVSGSGNTGNAVNGKGNLIVGYNENGADTRTGSHNLVIGAFHSYSSYGGFIAGFENAVSGAYSSVSGGEYNTASGAYSSVSGGQGNTASSSHSSVSGGDNNTASGDWSSVSGGFNGSASGTFDWVAGALFQDD